MRKILLTTTALVALGGVSAASALEISGFQRFIYSSWDDTASTEFDGNNDSELVNYMRLQFNHDVTTDSGLNIGMYSRVNNIADGSYEHIGISGDFGTLSIGNYDTPGGNMYSSLLYDGKFVDDIDQTFLNGQGGTNTLSGSAAAALMDEAATYAVAYTLPSINGFTVQVAQGDSGTTTQADAQEIGISYSQDLGDVGMTAHFVSAESDDTTGAANDEQDNQEFGVVLTSGAFKFRGTTSNNETVGIDGVTDTDLESNEYSIEYNVDAGWDVALISFSSKDEMDTTNSSNVEQTIFATRYTLAPGVLAYASYADFDYEGATANAGSQTNIGLRVNF